MLSRIGAELLRVVRLVGFGAFFAYELLVASLQVAWDVITPRSRLSPGIVAISMQSTTPAEMTLMANLISLTPGTLSLTINEDQSMLYVHGMYVGSADEFRHTLHVFERRMLSAVRTHNRPGGAS
ncbi:Na+/H+ antiporter subunit E [Phytoactinopolyspora halophila]|nr:Na+/H+ antiporter subunit E [Phytoactinopolyspora halophila]